MSSIAIIIPTLNEAGAIERLLNLIFAVTREHNFGTEVIVVDDGSQDGTRETVADLCSRLPITLICRNDRQGLASAVVEGAHAAQNDLVVVMDGDLSHSPQYIPQLVRPLLDGAFDIAIGSRYTPGGSTPDWPLKRKVFSKLASFPAQLLTGVDDPLSGFFAVSRTRLIAVNPNVAGYKICLEVLLGKRDTMKITEIPICFHDRQSGTSKMSMSVIRSYFGQLARLCSMPISSRFWAIFFTLIVTGLVTEMIVYSLCTSLKAAFFSAHLLAFMGSVFVMLFAHHFFYPRRTLKPKILYQPSFWLLLALLLTFRFGVYGFVQNLSGGSPQIPTALAMACSVSAVTLFISRWYFRP